MKKYEMVYEATSFDGHQVFACEAENEEEAKKKFKAGECDIIEQSVEVLGLGELHDICESDDIESRLPYHLLAVACDDLEESKKMVAEMYHMIETVKGIIPHIVATHDSLEIDALEHDIDKLLAKARGEQ